MKRITMTNIGPGKSGKGGKFGNQVFKYAFLKIYASHYRLKVETSPWAGQSLFGHKDPPVTHRFPSLSIKDISLKELYKQKKPPIADVDLTGHYLTHTSFYRPFQSQFRSLFQPTKNVAAQVKPGLQKLRNMGDTIVGIHVRRGDYLLYKNHYNHWIAPTQWYAKWLEKIWPTLKNPVLFIASDDLPNVLPDFKRYRPVTSNQLIKDFRLSVPTPLDVSFYPDYYLLTQCDYLSISNSTFSFSASMLNERCNVFMRPDINKQKLVKYDPWNSSTHIKFKME